MPAKIAFGKKKEASLIVPAERRWVVIDATSKRRVYLPSEAGLTKEAAKEMAARRLMASEIVPEAALDRFGKLDASLLEEAIAVAEAPEEED